VFINEHSIPTGDEVCIPTGDEVCIALQHTSHHPVKYRITFGRSATTTDQNLKARLTRDDGENWEDLPVRPLKTGGQLPWVVSIRGRERIQMEICATCGVPVMAGPSQALQTEAVTPPVTATADNALLTTLAEDLNKLNDAVAKANDDRGKTNKDLNEIKDALKSLEKQLNLRRQKIENSIAQLLLTPDSMNLVAAAITSEKKITQLVWTTHPAVIRIAGPRKPLGSAFPHIDFAAQLRFRIEYGGRKLVTEPISTHFTATESGLLLETHFHQVVAQRLEQQLLGMRAEPGRYTIKCEIELDGDYAVSNIGNDAVLQIVVD